MRAEPAAQASGAAPPEAIPFRDALWVWVKIGLLSFGGPAGQIALMHRMLVEERRWIGEERFLHALNYCMLLPGPEAQQLATYIGWLMHRTWGGLVAGTLFVLPGFIVIMLLSTLYAAFAEVPLVAALFYGIKAAVLAVVVEAVHRIGRRALRNGLMLGLAGAAFVGIFFLAIPFPLIVLGAGLIGFVGARLRPDYFDVNGGHGAGSGIAYGLVDRLIDAGALPHTRPSQRRALATAAICLSLWLGPVLALAAALGWGDTFTQIGVFFSKMAVVTFGGAYAVLAYVAQQAVENYGWLSPGEMLDGLGLAETTPGPLILVLEFVGFLAGHRSGAGLDPIAAGVLGAGLAVWVTFVPCFLWILVGAPYVEALRGRRALSAALSAITAAVVGVVLNLAVWFGLHVLFADVAERWVGPVRLYVPDWWTLDPAALLLALGAFVALYRFRAGMLPVLAAAAALGAAYRLLLG